MIRREVLTYLGALALSPFAATSARAVDAAGECELFSPSRLYDIARDVAARPYRPRPVVPQAWHDLTYDQYKSIGYRHDKSIWAGTASPLQIDLMAPGLYYRKPVEVNIVEEGRSRRVPFDWALFETGGDLPQLPFDDSLGYSGLRLTTELEKPGAFQEYAVFQGASYFRVVGRGQIYGLSARGLAIDTAARGGEEFPDFTRFWVERPAPGATRHRMHALMESPSVTGIYHFLLHPGEATEVAVRATLFPRRALENVGIAPLTSMFYFDETNRGRFDDFRSAVHDSDGLSVLNGAGEMLWRPLANPRHIQISGFMDDGPQGFGLAQRARSFEDYADLDARYERRPSLWITPGEPWGKGAVTLVEIPTDKEIYDNIVAYWRPAVPLEAGTEHHLSYRMTWGAEIAPPVPVARVRNTRLGRGFVESEDSVEEGTVVTVDFEPHPALPADLDRLAVFVGANRGWVSDGAISRNPDTGGPRLMFRFDPGAETTVELRAQLMLDRRRVSEVWLYRWTA